MKYIKHFKSTSDYLSFNTGEDWLTPNISLIEETNKVYYNKKETIQLCDVAYWDGTNVMTTSLDKWDTSFGTPIGVVVIPEFFLPDGKCRIVALNRGADKFGSNQLKWSQVYNDTVLTNNIKVPITNNTSLISTTYSNVDMSTVCWFPSDVFTGTKSFVDGKSKYSSSASRYIPSPYKGKNFNTDYIKNIDGGNMLSDMNGLSNTEKLIQLPSNDDYSAANAAWNYEDGSSNLQWYMPTAGEFGFVIARLKQINDAIELLNGVQIESGLNYWISNENSNDAAYCIGTGSGGMAARSKDYANYVTPFAII